MPAFSVATAGAVLIDELYHDQLVSSIYYNNWMGLIGPGGGELFPKKRQAGGTSSKWIIRRAGTTPEIFTEGQAQAQPESATYSACSVSWTYFRSMIQVTGHARDAMQSSYVAGGNDVISMEIESAGKDVNDLMAVTFLGSSYGLEAAVDSATSYAGITRGSASWFESYENTSSGQMRYAVMATALEALLDNDRGGVSQYGCAILMPWNQVFNLFTISGPSAISMVAANDKAASILQQNFAGYPIYGIGDLTDTVTIFLCTAPNKNVIDVIRPLEVKAMAPSGDSDIYQISTGAAIIDRNPIWDAKLSGLDA